MYSVTYESNRKFGALDVFRLLAALLTSRVESDKLLFLCDIKSAVKSYLTPLGAGGFANRG
jgi:hypothetical protein